MLRGFKKQEYNENRRRGERFGALVGKLRRQKRTKTVAHQESQDSISIGKRAEDSVAPFVERNGMKVLARNVSYGWGEIDIVAQEGDVIVCIEVKSQQGTQSGFVPEHHFDYRKAEQVKKVFEAYLREHDLIDRQQRIDLAAVILQGETAKIRYYKNVVE